MAKKKAKHAGGRPQKYDEDTRLVTARLPVSIVDRVDAYANRHGMNRTEVIILAINRLKLPEKKAE